MKTKGEVMERST